MRIHCNFAAILLFAGLATAVAFGNPASADSYTLAYKFTAGQVHRYAMTMDMSDQMNMSGKSMPINVHSEMTTKQTTESVDPTTKAGTVQSTVAVQSETMNGQPMPMQSMQKMLANPITTVISPDGKVTTMSSNSALPQIPGMTGPGGFGTMTFLPDGPINIGDSWTRSFPIPTLGISLNMTMTLESVEIVNGDHVATINMKMTSGSSTLPPSQGPVTVSSVTMTGQSVTTFDIDAGTYTGTSATMVMDMVTSAKSPSAMSTSGSVHMNMKMLMTLLPGT